jgi:hypothetical protein
VATCSVGGVDLGEWLVRNALALDWPQYSRGRYDELQREAEHVGRGIWERAMSSRGYSALRALLVVHGFITAAAGLVLTVAPSLIPSVVGIYLAPSAYVLAYLLAGAEFGFSALSFGGSRLTDARALRLVAWTCIVFHASSGVLELYAYAHGASVAIVGNVVARAVIVGLLAYLARD